jgi:hypothetical protein
MLLSKIQVDRGVFPSTPILILVLLIALAPRALAQQVAASDLSGNVTDPSGQLIVGARVRITEAAKGKVHSTTTGPMGLYPGLTLPTSYTNNHVAYGNTESFGPGGNI